jgi:hypothetical protein
MIKPDDIASDDVWDTLVAAASGDAARLRTLLQASPALARAQYFYTPAAHFAVREGHLEATRVLIEAGADPEHNGYYDGSLVEMARERGHTAIVSFLEDVRGRTGRTRPGDPWADHPVHAAAEAGDLRRVRALLDAEPGLVNRGDRTGGPPLHRAVLGSAYAVAELLLDRGADVNATHGAGVPTTANEAQAIDLTRILHASARPGRTPGARSRRRWNSVTTPLLDCCWIAAPIRTGRSRARPVVPPCMRPPASATSRSWSCSSRAVPTPTASSTRRATPRSSPGRRRSAPR